MEKLSRGMQILKNVQERAEAERKANAEKEAKRKERLFMRRLLAVSILMIGLFSMVSFANGLFDSEEREQRKMEYIQEQLVKYNQVEIQVFEGQTAWNIQSELLSDANVQEDVRDVLYLVEYVNQHDTMGNVKAGQTYIFLEPKTKE